MGGLIDAGPEVRTTCPYCGVGCGVRARATDGGAVISGDEAHPANFGRLCSKGSALGETLDLEERLLSPWLRGVGEIEWDRAIGVLAERFSETIDRHGPDSVAIYGSGQLLTEDYYVANKLMKGFIGSGNIDTNSRLCMASTVAGHKRGFGADLVPGAYDDIEEADLVVLVGSNLAWCHPVLHQRLAAAKAERPGLKIVNIDPRRTATTDLADVHLSLAPGSDVALWTGLLAEIVRRGAVDQTYVAAHVSGADAAFFAALDMDAQAVGAATGLTPDEIATFYEAWIKTERVVTLWSQGVNQSEDGVDKVNAILNVHLATGRIGKPGRGPFSLTGQPNAMGGREVGGLANMLACHLDIENAAHRDAVAAFWRAPRMAAGGGLKAVEMFDAVASGRIRALWVISTNPAASMPNADAVRAAIAACPFVAVSDVTSRTDTAAVADLLLPAAGWGEKSGTVTNSERRISRQRPFRPAPGLARADWRIISDVGVAMGWPEAFDYRSAADVFREHAALSGVAAALGSDFDISGLADIDDGAYDALDPVRWPIPKSGASGGRFFAKGGFFTPDRRARMIALAPRPRVEAKTATLRLNTGRIRDQWHTMTRTALSARLNRHVAEPFLEIHPDDATSAQLGPADLAVVRSPHGAAILRVLVADRTPRGSAFAPMHWTARHAPAGRVDALAAPIVDPISGQPALKAAAVSVSRYAAAWHGFAVSRLEPDPSADYWARARTDGGWRLEIADAAAPEDWEAYAREVLRVSPTAAAAIAALGARRARIAFHDDGRLVGAFFAAPEPVAVSRAFVTSAFAASDDGAETSPEALLAGRPAGDRPDPGPIVCACLGVGANDIRSAVEARGLLDVASIGAATGAGTSCGSCRPEIQALLNAEPAPRAEAAE